MKTKQCFLDAVSRRLTLLMLAIAAGFCGMAQARTADTTTAFPSRPSLQQPAPHSILGVGNFLESWDSYTVGVNVHGQGGWKGWAK